MDYCIEGQDHSEASVSVFIQMISSKPPDILVPKLVLWCIIMSWSVLQKDWLLLSRLRSQQGLIWSKYDSFNYIFWTTDPFATKLSLIVYYHKPRVSYEEIGLLCSKSRLHQNFKMSVDVGPYDIFWIAEAITTKLSLVMHHHEPDCLAKKIGLLSGRSWS